MSTMDWTLDGQDEDVKRWLARAFAAERAPRRAMVAVPAAAPRAAGDRSSQVRGFYWSMLALSLLGWLFA